MTVQFGRLLGVRILVPLLVATAGKFRTLVPQGCVSNGSGRNPEDRMLLAEVVFGLTNLTGVDILGLWYPLPPKAGILTTRDCSCPDSFGPSVPPKSPRQCGPHRTLVPPRAGSSHRTLVPPDETLHGSSMPVPSVSLWRGPSGDSDFSTPGRCQT